MVIPSGLMPSFDSQKNRLVYLNRGFEKCLTLYPFDTWKSIMVELEKLNMYNMKSRTFIRYMMRGLSEMELDKSNRLRIPETLQNYAGISREVLVVGHLSRIEIWDPSEYDKVLSDEPADFASLAEEVMTGKSLEDLKGFSFN